jgi:predicted transcriptional regulator
MKHIKVADIMTRDPIKIKPETHLLDCAKIMVKKRVGNLLLVHKKKLVGTISRKDILWALVKKSKKDLSSIKAIDISPKKIGTIRPSATVDETIKKMKRLKFPRLPVIQNNELVGLITRRDILNFSPEAYPELEELEQIREETRKLKRIKQRKTKLPSAIEGVCEECGNFDVLYGTDGSLICVNCR